MGASGISLDGVILALFLLALTAIGAMVMVYGSNIMKAIKQLSDDLKDHMEQDDERFDTTDRRIGIHAQRLTKIDGQTE